MKTGTRKVDRTSPKRVRSRMLKRRVSRKFLNPEDASKIAGVLFAMRFGPVASDVVKDLRPNDAFAKEVVSALLVSGKRLRTASPVTVKTSAQAREVARELRKLGRRPAKHVSR